MEINTVQILYDLIHDLHKLTTQLMKQRTMSCRFLPAFNHQIVAKTLI